MARNKHVARKIRLLRVMKGNRRVPSWVMMRTSRRFQRHPKRHMWKRSNLQR